MKLAKYVDYGTRIISMTVPIRANHAMVKNRLTMMLQMTSLGGVLPSFELQSRVDIIDYEWVFSVLYMNGMLVIFFIVNEGIEAYLDGFGNYFTNMWNLMDWSGSQTLTLTLTLTPTPTPIPTLTRTLTVTLPLPLPRCTCAPLRRAPPP